MPPLGYSPLLTLGGGNRLDPRSQPDLKLWLDAQDQSSVSRDGSDIVTTWLDKSGQANNAAQATANQKPKYIASAINSRPALRGKHDGTNNSVLQVPDHASLDYTTFEAFVVCQRVNDVGANSHIFGKYTASGNQREQRVYFGTGAPGAAGGGTSANGTAVVGSFNSVPALSSGTGYIFGYRYDGVNQILSINGTDIDTDAQSGIFNGTATIDLFGREATPAEPFDGFIGEAIFYTVVRSTGQRAALMAYLKARWSIA